MTSIVWGMHQFPVVSLHNEPVMQSFDDSLLLTQKSLYFSK